MKEQIFKKGQIVWVRDSEYHPWAITFFRFRNPDLNYSYFCSYTNEDENVEGWIYITKQNPYENREA